MKQYVVEIRDEKENVVGYIVNDGQFTHNINDAMLFDYGIDASGYVSRYNEELGKDTYAIEFEIETDDSQYPS